MSTPPEDPSLNPEEMPEASEPDASSENSEQLPEPLEPIEGMPEASEPDTSSENSEQLPESLEPMEEMPEFSEPMLTSENPEPVDQDSQLVPTIEPPPQMPDEPVSAAMSEVEDKLVDIVYQIWWRWADFQLFIVSPTIAPISPPVVIPPDHVIESDELEFVYTIHDHGHMMCTSKGEEMYTSGMSMCKLYYTIEKMIFLLVERLKSGGIGTDVEVQVAFGGHEFAQRKGFESIINLSYNVVVTNFDPGAWGERYLQVVRRLADKGYGYPPEAPRDTYRHVHHSTSPGSS